MLHSGRYPFLVLLITVNSMTYSGTSVKEIGRSWLGRGVEAGSPKLCAKFSQGLLEKKEFYSPNYPGLYPNRTDCFKIIEAPRGHLIRLDFRDQFVLEASEGCGFDFLEVRDGEHGYSRLIGKYCGTSFPPIITSSSRYLWLRFRSDENIEYSGFRAVYSFIPRPTTEGPEMVGCRIELTGVEGYVNRSDIDREHARQALEYGKPLDCVWVIRVEQGWRIQLLFHTFQLEVPNDCEANFLDVFSERTDLSSRLYNFCGSMAEFVLSPSNVLIIRFFSEPSSFNSNFEALYTAFKEKPFGSGSCETGLYDCEDGMCISWHLKCNGRVNCRLRWDEDHDCQYNNGYFNLLSSEHVIFILIVFFAILLGIIGVFVVNCVNKFRKIRESSKEEKRSRESSLEGIVTKGPEGSLSLVTKGECHVPSYGELVLIPTKKSAEPPPPSRSRGPPKKEEELSLADIGVLQPPPGFTTFGYMPEPVGLPPLTPIPEAIEPSAPDVIMTH